MRKEQEYAKTTFDSVATHYDEIPFFKISARYVVEIIKKHTNAKNIEILDVACGTGNVVLECAACMPDASFDAVDIAEGMLAKARENAKQNNQENIHFYLQDITTMDVEKKYDVITCSYALFFLPEAEVVLKTLMGLLNPDGMLVFTTFLANAFSTSNSVLIPLLKEHGSASAQEFDRYKWENLKHVKDIEHLCALASVKNVQIQSKEIRYGMCIDEWWELMNNTGYKGMLMELDRVDYERVKQLYYEGMVSYADMDGEVELIADSYFVVVRL